MKHVVWQPRAIADFERDQDWLRARSPNAADALAQVIARFVDRLCEGRDTGRPGRFAGTREQSIPRFSKVIVYRVSEDTIDILAILDVRRAPPDDLPTDL